MQIKSNAESSRWSFLHYFWPVLSYQLSEKYWFYTGLIQVCLYLHSLYSQISISRSWWDYFLQVQITRSANQFAFRVIWTCKKVSNAKLWFVKAIKMYHLSDRRFEFHRIRDIRVRDIESWLYIDKLDKFCFFERVESRVDCKLTSLTSFVSSIQRVEYSSIRLMKSGWLTFHLQQHTFSDQIFK